MIEDTFATIEALNFFSVNVMKDIDPDLIFAQNNDDDDDNDENENENDDEDEEMFKGISMSKDKAATDTKKDAKSIRKSQLLEKTPFTERGRTKIMVRGRVIELLVPKTTCKKFCKEFRTLLNNPWGFTCNFNTFFFSQGINIQQALKMSSDPLQNAINSTSFDKLNQFYQILDKMNKEKLRLQKMVEEDEKGDGDDDDDDDADAGDSNNNGVGGDGAGASVRISSLNTKLLSRRKSMSSILYCHPLLVRMMQSLKDSNSHAQQVLHCTALYCNVLQCTALYCNVLHCTAMYCTVLHCTAMYCNVLHCTALYCSIQ